MPIDFSFGVQDSETTVRHLDCMGVAFLCEDISALMVQRLTKYQPWQLMAHTGQLFCSKISTWLSMSMNFNIIINLSGSYRTQLKWID